VVNRIVREHYPVERLPEDLRQELKSASMVTLVIEAENDTSLRGRRAAAVADLLNRRRSLLPTAQDSVQRVRELRDEWDR
jgi:hypothetical protein